MGLNAPSVEQGATVGDVAKVRVSEAGWDLVDQILAAIADLQRSDPMRSVAVVSSTAVGASRLHRAMLDRLAHHGLPGLVGVESATLNGLARQILLDATGDPLARIANRLEIGAAVRSVLLDEPGGFQTVATHRTTIERMVAYFQELAGLPSADFDALFGSAEGLQSDAIRVVVGALGRLRAVSSESDAIDVIDDHLRHEPRKLERSVILVNPDPFRPFEARLVEGLSQRGEVVTVVCRSGDTESDRRYNDRLAHLGIVSGLGSDGSTIQGSADLSIDISIGKGAPGDHVGQQKSSGQNVSAYGAELVEVAAPDDEVRSALRRLTALAADGVPLSRMALLFASAEPYADIVRSQLSLAGIPWSGPGHRPLASSVAGRVLRHCLRLAADGVDRSGLFAFLGNAPMLDQRGRAVPVVLWDQLSKQAGVIEPEHWGPRLDELRQALQSPDSLAGPGADRSAMEAAGRTAAEETGAIQSFVDELVELLTPPAEPSWGSWASWARKLLTRYTRPGEDGEAWPEVELHARERVFGILDELATLDGLSSVSSTGGGKALAGPTLATVDATIDLELSGLVMPGESGGGLYVGDINSVVGLPFESIAVVGLAEGRYPRMPQENPLLPHRLRAMSGRYLPDERQLTHADVRALALVSAAGRLGTTFYVSRGDMRSSRSRDVPGQVESMVVSRTVIDSHYQGLLADGRPISVDDFGLRSLMAHSQARMPLEDHDLVSMDNALTQGIRRFRDLQTTELGPFSGLVGATLLDMERHVFSPTALETYAACPRKYLLARVLRLSEQRRPERITSIDGLERGSLVHRILERFVAEAIDEGDVPDPDDAWSVERRNRLMELVDEEVKLARGRGVTGGEVHTEILRLELVREMGRFLSRDSQFRKQHRSRPIGTEFAFGFSDRPLEVEIGAGRVLSLRGSVDRVDVTDDDGLVVVDYKGGRGTQYRDVVDNPLDDGRRLQLPLYAKALAQHQSRSGSRVGVYWLTSVDEVKEMALDEVDADLRDLVGTALDGIEAGLFPAIPGGTTMWPRPTHDNCKYCDFDLLCPTDRRREWEMVRQDPAVKLIERLRKDGELDAETEEKPGSRQSADTGRNADGGTDGEVPA